MNTNFNGSIQLTTVYMNEPDWSDHTSIAQSVALEIKNYLESNPPPVERQLYIRDFDILKNYGYGFKYLRDGFCENAGWNHLKCKALIDIINNLSPYIVIVNNNFNTDSEDISWPATQAEIFKTSSTKVEKLLAISEKAMSVLDQYKSEQEIEEKKEKEQRQERQILLDKKDNCCTLL
jgi:hypothetical protein